MMFFWRKKVFLFQENFYLFLLFLSSVTSIELGRFNIYYWEYLIFTAQTIWYHMVAPYMKRICWYIKIDFYFSDIFFCYAFAHCIASPLSPQMTIFQIFKKLKHSFFKNIASEVNVADLIFETKNYWVIILSFYYPLAKEIDPIKHWRVYCGQKGNKSGVFVIECDRNPTLCFVSCFEIYSTKH